MRWCKHCHHNISCLKRSLCDSGNEENLFFKVTLHKLIKYLCSHLIFSICYAFIAQSDMSYWYQPDRLRSRSHQTHLTVQCDTIIGVTQFNCTFTHWSKISYWWSVGLWSAKAIRCVRLTYYSMTHCILSGNTYICQRPQKPFFSLNKLICNELFFPLSFLTGLMILDYVVKNA